LEGLYLIHYTIYLMGVVLDLLNMYPLGERIIRVELFNKTIFPVEINAVTLAMLYPHPLRIRRKILFWEFTKIIHGEELASKVVFFRRMPPRSKRSWELKLAKPYVRGRRYRLEVEGRLILGKVRGGVVPVVTPKGVC